MWLTAKILFIYKTKTTQRRKVGKGYHKLSGEIQINAFQLWKCLCFH
jgi:hypothetical protein